MQNQSTTANLLQQSRSDIPADAEDRRQLDLPFAETAMPFVPPRTKTDALRDCVSKGLI